MNRVGEKCDLEPQERGCRAAREQLRLAWSEGRLRETLNPAAEKDPADAGTLARHLEECVNCQREAKSLGTLDRVLSDGFRQVELSTSLPSEDRIASMLRSVPIHPSVPLLRRTRRSVKTMLWMTFFFLSLLACCALGAVAYRVLFHR